MACDASSRHGRDGIVRFLFSGNAMMQWEAKKTKKNVCFCVSAVFPATRASADELSLAEVLTEYLIPGTFLVLRK